MSLFRNATLLCSATVGLACPATAATVTLSGLVINTCILTVTSPGVLAASNDGTTLGSEQAGGNFASLTVVATGTSPTLTFSAPILTSGATTAGATTEIAYNASGSGANQAYTSSQTSASSNLIDTFRINARVTRTAGFSSGTYTVTTIVTCSQ